MSNFRTLLFIFVLCVIAGSSLSGLKMVLRERQDIEETTYRKKQLLLSARILDYEYKPQIKVDGKYVGAKLLENKLVAGEATKIDKQELSKIYDISIESKLLTLEGDFIEYKDTDLEEAVYLEWIKKQSFEDLKYLPIFVIGEERGYIVPVQGYGLWSHLYGYLAIESNGHTVLATTWYQHEETAGLGADISLPYWQKQFHGKDIFLAEEDGSIDPTKAPLGISVVKGGVENLSPAKANNSVDVISGATKTPEGVMIAYKTCLAPYRPFLVKIFKK